MARFKAHRYVPSVLLSAVAAVPLLTAGEILAHMGKSAGPPAPIPNPGQGAKGTSTPASPRPTPTAQSTPTPQSTPAPQPTPAPQSTLEPQSTPAPSPTSSGARGATGTFQGGSYPDMFGYLSASITVRGGKIVGVSISAPMDNPRSSYINSIAVPILKSETLKAQSSNINGISGATATSQAYYYSLTDSLKKAGL